MLEFKKKITLNLQKVYDISKNTKKVLCEVNSPEYTYNEIKSAAIDLFANKVSMVKSSFRKVADNFVTFIVMPNKISKPYDKAKYKTISSDIVSDVQDNSIWKVVDVDGEKRIVLMDDQNFNKIFETSNRVATFAAVYKEPKADVNDYVSFYSTKADKLMSGLVTENNEDSLIVLDRNCVYHKITSSAVVDVADLHNTSISVCLANLTQAMGDKVLEYYKKLYDNTDFFDKLDELVGIDVSKQDDKSLMVTSTILDDATIEDIKNQLREFFLTIDQNEEDVGNTDGDFEVEDVGLQFDPNTDFYPEVTEENKESDIVYYDPEDNTTYYKFNYKN